MNQDIIQIICNYLEHYEFYKLRKEFKLDTNYYFKNYSDQSNRDLIFYKLRTSKIFYEFANKIIDKHYSKLPTWIDEKEFRKEIAYNIISNILMCFDFDHPIINVPTKVIIPILDCVETNLRSYLVPDEILSFIPDRLDKLKKNRDELVEYYKNEDIDDQTPLNLDEFIVH